MIAQAQLHPDPDAAVQRELGHLFADLRPLYHGRLASVYLARDVKSRATVALKTILRLRFLAPGNASRFRRQTVAAARLDHPNIVSVHRHGVSPSFLWYSMDYCPGGPSAPSSRWQSSTASGPCSTSGVRSTTRTAAELCTLICAHSTSCSMRAARYESPISVSCARSAA